MDVKTSLTLAKEAFLRVQSYGYVDTLNAAARIAVHNRGYLLDSHARRHSKLPARDDAKICRDLTSIGITVAPYAVDERAFRRWLSEARFPQEYIDLWAASDDLWPEWPDLFIEKALEYYVSASLLGLNESDIILDIGARKTPFSSMVERIYGCEGYALDRQFQPGIHGKQIGANATATPLPDGFATKITLNSAYHQFEGTADMRFLSEAHRILRDNGKMIVLPLYIDHSYYVLWDPYRDASNIDRDGAEIVWDDYRWPERFVRFYSVEAFNERVIANRCGFSATVYYIKNARDIASRIDWPKHYLGFAALFEKTPASDEERAKKP